MFLVAAAREELIKEEISVELLDAALFTFSDATAMAHGSCLR